MSPRPTPVPTQYEFISHEGGRDASAKQKLKTVRSHVMRNYLHQQQQQQQQQQQSGRSGPSSKSVASERRQAKERARSSRSASRGTDASISPTLSESPRTRFSIGDAGSFDVGFSVPGFGSEQRGAREFDYTPQPDVVSCLAQLYASCVSRDKHAGFLQPSFDTLNAKGETMRAVQETLAICGNDVPETVLFAIGVLAHGCSANQEWSEVMGHNEALRRLVEMRRGMQTVDFELQRLLTCTSYFVSAELLLPPQFPLPLFPSPIAFNLAFQDDAQIHAWRTVKRFPKNTSFVFDIVVRLHQLGLALSPEWYDKIDPRALSNLYFEALQSAILVQLEEPWQGQLPSGTQGQEAAIMFKVWAAGLPVFVCSAIQQLKERKGFHCPRYSHGPLFSRMKTILDGDGGYHSWPRGRNLEPVLVTLLYALEACAWGDPWRAWCIDTMRKVVELLKLKTAKEFKKALEFFPSTHVLQNMADDVWAELTQGSVASTPSCILQVFGER
ncbi:hypothetical protein N0V90_007603 [Kalmusia sp. IMI 367209]|nr:hypothetical protein N0V90_007603 [Kalmusia sp. IMI 367209]